MRSLITEKNQKLLEALEHTYQLQQSAVQFTGERQALRGEVQLLQQQQQDSQRIADELRQRFGEERARCAESERRSLAAERVRDEALQRASETEARSTALAREGDSARRDAEQRVFEATQCAAALEQRCAYLERTSDEVQMRAWSTEERAGHLEQEVLEARQRMQVSEVELQALAQGRAKELEVRCMNTELQRRQQMHSALQGLHILQPRTQGDRPEDFSLASMGSGTLRLPVTSTSSLLSGQVKAQVEMLTSASQLAQLQISTPESTALVPVRGLSVVDMPEGQPRMSYMH